MREDRIIRDVQVADAGKQIIRWSTWYLVLSQIVDGFLDLTGKVLDHQRRQGFNS